MKLKLIIGACVIAAAGAGAFFYLKDGQSFQKVTYKTAEVTVGSVETTISSTGTLNPVSSIEVGTQVSGTIEKVYVDYNDLVKKNQIIAEIDRQPLLSKLSQARSAYVRCEALYEQAKDTYERDKTLHEKSIISDEEFAAAKTEYLTQKASLESAKAEVETAQTNLSYATIKSPVNGTVIEKSVDVGQTVAASLSAPTLFIIAEDLKNMEILADVDESDIGKITTDQEVKFKVPAFPDKKYTGKVSQVRLQPTTTQSVVTYTVVIKATNEDGTLLPGMTANVDFITEKAENVLLVPAAALRFKPSDQTIAQSRPKRNSNMMPPPPSKDSAAVSGQQRDSGQNGTLSAGKSATVENRGTVWVLNDSNEVHPEFVKLGISDGTNTEVTGRRLEAGMKVVTGTVEKKKETKQSRSLFGPQGSKSSSKSESTSTTSKQSSNMPPPPPGGF